jgi:SAM-dependent methyltransferase
VPENYFDEPVAACYDDPADPSFQAGTIEPAVAFLAELAGPDASALEFGIGTGRIALPLSQRGVRVDGIDLSPAMLNRLRAKPGADRIGVTVGDFAQTRVPGSYRLGYLVFNTIMNLTSQDAQVACFRNIAAHLKDGGCFVIEVMVPDLQRLPPGETVRPFHVGPDRLGFDEYDLVSQSLTSHHFRLQDGQFIRNSVPFRYVWPAELDLMAALAGLRLRERWNDWGLGPFTSDSRQHISVWELPG